TFSYDPAGNLIQQPGLAGVLVQGGNRLLTANGYRFEYNLRNHLTQKHNGAATTQYDYDSRDMLVACRSKQQHWQAQYDPLGRRINKTVQGQKTTYYWDTDRLVAEINPQGQLRIYLYASTLALTPFMFLEYEGIEAAPDAGNRYFIFCNHVGTPIRVEDEMAQTVWQAQVSPYGTIEVEVGASFSMPLRFAGHYYDSETGLHYNRFRYYDPQLGRYMQSDPQGIGGGLNLYAYAKGNPLRWVDVRGLGCGGDDGGSTKNNEDGVDVESTQSRAREIPEGGQSIEQRLKEGGNLPPHVKNNPNKYYYDPDTGTYKRRPEPKPQFSEGKKIPCFPKGTLVVTAVGNLPIENITIGTIVLTFDETCKTHVYKPTTALLQNETLRLVELTIENEIICVTTRHRFWVENKEQWIAAQYLRPGMFLRTSRGKIKQIKMVNLSQVDKQNTYNLTVADNHTYFVGKEGFLVHNEDEPPNGKVYVGRDPNTGEVIYVGQTKQDIDSREAQHHRDSEKYPDKYGFKEGMKLEVVQDGLTDDEMDYHERRVYDEYGGEEKLKNRQIPMTDEKINALENEYCS
ncbi:MAG: RHS repeat-associated core domain-containing protein, partial [Pseudomonadota bacterium]|nr:RHS repeat-associated core domain-containing protein [Pseudomonadota bacterium]